MNIRAAKEGDTKAIADIWNHGVRDSVVTFTSKLKTPQDIVAMIRRRAASGDIFLVSKAPDGSLSGFCTTGPFRHGPGYTHSREHSIHLAPSVQGLGLGRALMLAVEQEARAGAVHVLIAAVAGGNASGIAFHKAMGFAEVGRLPEVGMKLGSWHDLVLMLKILCPHDSGADTR